MCTASWLIDEQGYELFFNRDESRGRGVARGPELVVLEGLRCLAPTDADAGGTWLGVNELGLAVGLLNGKSAGASGVGAGVAPAAPGTRSRGLLVRELLGARGADEVAERLERMPLGTYRGFTLLALEPGRAPELHVWDGIERRRAAARLPLCSSSLDGTRAQAERVRVFEELARERGLDAEMLAEFHRSHEPERGPWSPCMHRDDARTVSASRVRVDEREVSFRYASGPPCTTGLGAPLFLERRSRHG